MSERVLTTTSRSFNEDLLPYRLFQKAKKLGVWDPKSIDLSQDKEDWQKLDEAQQQQILRLISMFQAGEEAVTLDLLPLINVIAKEGRLEEELFLTTFLFEEAKHTEFFRLVLDAIGETGDLSHYHTGTYRKIFYEILPEAMGRLEHDQSPEAVAEAAIVYNMLVEGMLAETGYHSFYNTLEKLNLMPGLLEGIGLLKRDESRHIGYGTFLLQRLISEHDHLYEFVMNKMEEMGKLALQVSEEGIEHSSGKNAFDSSSEETRQFTKRQFEIRMNILKRAKGKNVSDIYKTRESEVGVM